MPVPVAPNPIPAGPPAPNPVDRPTFNGRVYPWAEWQVAGLAPGANELAGNVYDNAVIAYDSANTAQAAALTASNANTTAGTSVTNYTPAIGAANLVYVEAGRTPQVGMRVRVASSAAPSTNYAAGIVTAWNAGTKTISINVDRIGPAPAAAAAWQIFAEGSPGLDGASASATTPLRVVAANGNITAADNGYMVKVTAAGVTLACDTPAVLSGSSVYFTASQHGVLLTGTFANLDGTNTAQTRAVPRGYSAILISDGTGLRLDLIAPAALYQHNPGAANYTFALVDQAAEIFHASADAVARTWTIPKQATVPFPKGTTIALAVQNGAGAITLTIDTGTLRWAGAGSTGNRTLSANALASITLIDPAANEWMLSGAGVS